MTTELAVLRKESGSDLQRRDLAQLLAGPVDHAYLERWSLELGVHSALKELIP